MLADQWVPAVLPDVSQAPQSVEEKPVDAYYDATRKEFIPMRSGVVPRLGNER